MQYASATGTSWQVTALTNVTLQPGGYYLVAESFGANGVGSIPAADATGGIAMNATAGKVALVNSVTALSGACPAASGFVDLVGYGTSANCSEAAPAPAPSTTKADIRNGDGCADTDHNSADFAAGAPNPRNSASAPHACAVAQMKTGETSSDVEWSLPSFNQLYLSGAFGSLTPAGRLPPGLLSAPRPSAGSTRWRRDAGAFCPRGTPAAPPRPRGASP